MKSNIKKLLKKEMREVFRDKKSLAMMLVIPLMIPLLVVGMSALFEMQMNKPVDKYNKIGFSYPLSDVEKEIIKDLEINPTYDSTEKLEEEYKNGNIHLYITKNQNSYTIHGENNDTTTYATTLADAYLSSYKEYLQQEYLTSENVEATQVLNILNIEKDIIEGENFFANYIINYTFLFIIMAITISSTYPATDTTAGEKERGTLETLLTFPIKSKDIILGKFLSVAISSMITGMISLLLTLGALQIASGMFKIYEGVSLMLPFSTLLFVLIVIIAYSFLISGLSIAIASRSKSFKEAQSALTPLTFISFFPGFIAFMINIKTNFFLALVPFLNFSLLFTDLTNGNVNLLNIIAMVVSTVIFITLLLVVIIRQYKSEKVLFSI